MYKIKKKSLIIMFIITITLVVVVICGIKHTTTRINQMQKEINYLVTRVEESYAEGYNNAIESAQPLGFNDSNTFSVAFGDTTKDYTVDTLEMVEDILPFQVKR